jgi:hypothetical protein
MKIVADFEVVKRAVNIRREPGIPPSTVRTVVAHKQKYRCCKMNFLKI